MYHKPTNLQHRACGEGNGAVTITMWYLMLILYYKVLCFVLFCSVSPCIIIQLRWALTVHMYRYMLHTKFSSRNWEISIQQSPLLNLNGNINFHNHIVHWTAVHTDMHCLLWNAFTMCIYYIYLQHMKGILYMWQADKLQTCAHALNMPFGKLHICIYTCHHTSLLNSINSAMNTHMQCHAVFHPANIRAGH